METHPYFDLKLHSSQELESLLGEPVLERVTLHEWPLSCVQRLLLPGGKSWIYKSQSSPSVEPEFYTRARSPLLVNARTIFRDERYACLLLEDLAPAGKPGENMLLGEMIQVEEEAVRIGRRLLAEIAAIEGRPPVYLDVSDWERWQAVMEAMIQDLDGLVAAGKYGITRREAVRAAARAAQAPEVQAVWAMGMGAGLVHHDLCAENVFAVRDGYRVLDWQRPILGPAEIDLVLFLTSLGFDPRGHVPPGITTITTLLHIHWLTECTRCWFPDGRETYDRSIAHLAMQLD